MTHHACFAPQRTVTPHTGRHHARSPGESERTKERQGWAQVQSGPTGSACAGTGTAPRRARLRSCSAATCERQITHAGEDQRQRPATMTLLHSCEGASPQTMTRASAQKDQTTARTTENRTACRGSRARRARQRRRTGSRARPPWWRQVTLTWSRCESERKPRCMRFSETPISAGDGTRDAED